jgi:hypothetical protein
LLPRRRVPRAGHSGWKLAFDPVFRALVYPPRNPREVSFFPLRFLFLLRSVFDFDIPVEFFSSFFDRFSR